MDATDFTLNWSTNNATACRLHFVAIGGRRDPAQVPGWTMRNDARACRLGIHLAPAVHLGERRPRLAGPRRAPGDRRGLCALKSSSGRGGPAASRRPHGSRPRPSAGTCPSAPCAGARLPAEVSGTHDAQRPPRDAGRDDRAD
jgi:hypothetical protein